jgi:hypothetical protein
MHHMPCFENNSSVRLDHGRGKTSNYKRRLQPQLWFLVEGLKERRGKMKLSSIMHQHGHSTQEIVS